MRKEKSYKRIIISLVLAFSFVFSFMIIILPINVSGLIQEDVFISTDDAHISFISKDTNYGSNIYIYAWGDDIYRTWLQFNISTIPLNQSILDVSLFLYKLGDMYNKYHDYSKLYYANSSWDESTITWNNAPNYYNEISRVYDDFQFGWVEYHNDTLTQNITENYENGTYIISFVMDSIDSGWDSFERLSYVSKDMVAVSGYEPYLLISYQSLYFISEPILTVEPEEKYEYIVISSIELADLNITTDANWIYLVNNSFNITGIPLADDLGFYLVNLSLYYQGNTTWQNYTIMVITEADFSPAFFLALIFSFGFLGLMLVRFEFAFLSGIVWILCSLIFFREYGEMFMILGLAVGMILIISGGMYVAKKA